MRRPRRQCDIQRNSGCCRVESLVGALENLAKGCHARTRYTGKSNWSTKPNGGKAALAHAPGVFEQHRLDRELLELLRGLDFDLPHPIEYVQPLDHLAEYAKPEFFGRLATMVEVRIVVQID